MPLLKSVVTRPLGLRLGAEERPENYSPISIAALFTRSFRDALNRVARYKKLTSPQDMRLSERGNEFAVQFLWLSAEVEESPIWIDSCFAWTVTIGRRGIGRNIHPLRVELRRAKLKQNSLRELLCVSCKVWGAAEPTVLSGGRCRSAVHNAQRRSA